MTLDDPVRRSLPKESHAGGDSPHPQGAKLSGSPPTRKPLTWLRLHSQSAVPTYGQNIECRWQQASSARPRRSVTSGADAPPAAGWRGRHARNGRLLRPSSVSDQTTIANKDPMAGFGGYSHPFTPGPRGLGGQPRIASQSGFRTLESAMTSPSTLVTTTVATGPTSVSCCSKTQGLTKR